MRSIARLHRRSLNFLARDANNARTHRGLNVVARHLFKTAPEYPQGMMHLPLTDAYMHRFAGDTLGRGCLFAATGVYFHRDARDYHKSGADFHGAVPHYHKKNDHFSRPAPTFDNRATDIRRAQRQN